MPPPSPPCQCAPPSLLSPRRRRRKGRGKGRAGCGVRSSTKPWGEGGREGGSGADVQVTEPLPGVRCPLSAPASVASQQAHGKYGQGELQSPARAPARSPRESLASCPSRASSGRPVDPGALRGLANPAGRGRLPVGPAAPVGCRDRPRDRGRWCRFP